MKKKIMIILNLIIIFLFLNGCSQKDKSQINTKEIADSKELKETNISTSEVLKTVTSSDGKQNLNNEELAMATYVENYVESKGDITKTIEWIKDAPYLEMGEKNDGWIISQGTGSSMGNINITKSEIKFTTQSGTYHIIEKNYQSSMINDKYSKYQNQLQDLIKVSKEAEKNEVDTKKLNEVQILAWVKNYLKYNGATEAEIEDIGFQTQTSEDGDFEVSIYTWTPTHNVRKLSYIYRVSETGQLQEKNAMSSEEWKTVSSNYID